MASMTVYYRPDNYPEWLLWKDFPDGFDIIGQKGAIDMGGNPTARAGFAPRVSLGKPASNCDDAVTDRQLRRGYEFHVKFTGTGHVIIDKFRMHAQRTVERSRAKH